MASSSTPVYNGSLIHLLAALPRESDKRITLPELAPDLTQAQQTLEAHSEIRALYQPTSRFLALLIQENISLFLAHSGELSKLGSYTADLGALEIFQLHEPIPRELLLDLLPQLSHLPLEERVRIEEPIPIDIARWREEDRGRTPLHFAAQLGDFKGVEALLDGGATPNQPDLDGYTPLHHAIRHGHRAVVEMLIHRGGDPTLITEEQESVFHLAADQGDETLFLVLLREVAQFEERGLSLSSPPQNRFDDGSLQIDRHSAQKWLHLVDSDGKTPLHRAVWDREKPKLIKLLIEYGTEVDRPNSYGYTALHWAAKHGHLESARLLFKAGAQGDLLNQNGDTPLALALKFQSQEVAHYFLSNSLTLQIKYHQDELLTIRSNAIQVFQNGPQIVQRSVAQGYQRVLSRLFQESLALAGRPLSRYALIALNELSRKELLFSTRPTAAILVENPDELPLFQRVAQFIQTSGVALSFLNDRSILVGTSADLARRLLQTPHFSFLAGDEEFARSYRKLLTTLLEKRRAPFSWWWWRPKEHQEEAILMLEGSLREWERFPPLTTFNIGALNFESDLYRPLDNALQSLLLYFNKSGPSREGIYHLPFTEAGQAALHQAYERATSLLLESQLFDRSPKRKDKIVIHKTVSSLYRSIAHFLERRRVQTLQEANFPPIQEEKRPIYLAAAKGDVEQIQALVDQGEPIDLFDLKGRTPLHLAIIHHRVEATSLLLSLHAESIPRTEREGATPLHFAALSGHLGVIDLILTHYSPQRVLDLRDSKGETALHWAIKGEKIQAIDSLLDRGGVRWMPLTENGATPLHFALLTNNLEIIDLILNHYSPEEIINRQEQEGETALHWAARTGEVEVARVLLGRGADPLILDRRGRSASDTALENGRDVLAQLILFRREPIEVIDYTTTSQTKSSGEVAREHFLRAYEIGDFQYQILFLLKDALSSLRRGDYKRSALTLNSALTIAQDSSISAECRSELARKIEEVERRFIIEKIGPARSGAYRNRIDEYKGRLRAIRSGLFLKKTTQERVEEISQGYMALLGDLFNDCVEIVGQQPPTSFAMVALGSLSRQEACPYSDVEFVFLVESSTEEVSAYFRRLSELMLFKIINFGETEFKIIQTSKGDKSLIPKGFSVDSGLSPLGKENLYELIQTPEGLASFQTHPEIAGAEFTTVHALRSCSLITGSQLLLNQYKEAMERILDPLRKAKAVELMEAANQEFKPKLDEKKIKMRAFNVKRELYRLPQMTIHALALYHGISANSTFDQIDQLRDRELISIMGADNLKIALEAALALRMKTHLFYCEEKEHLYFPRWDEERDEKLMNVTPSLNLLIIEIYRTLVPLHERSEAFLKGDESAFANNLFYNSEVGKYDDSLTKELDFVGAHRSAVSALSLNLHSPASHSAVGLAEIDLGQARVALRRLEETYHLLKTKYRNQPHPDVAGSLINLGVAYNDSGDYERAIHYHQKALKMQRQIYGDQSHLDVASGLNNLGSSYYYLGNYSRAIDYCLQSLAMRKQIQGDQPDSYVATNLNNLGNGYRSLGDYDRALDYYQQALAIQKQIHGDRPHPDVARSLNNLGTVYCSLSDYELAIKYYQESLAMSKEIHSDQPHPDVARNLNNLGNGYSSLGEYERAINYHQQSLAMKKQIHDDQPHPEVAGSLNNLGNAYNALGNYERAIDYHQQALAMSKQIYGDRPHTDVADSLSNLGLSYGFLDKYERAIGYHQQALAMQKQIHGNQPHPDVTKSLDNLGNAYNSLSEYERAIGYHQQALAMKKEIHGDRPHPDVAGSLDNLGNAYNSLSEYERAIGYHQQALAMKKEIHGDRPHPDVAGSLNSLGLVYKGLGDYRGAIKYQEQALAIQKQVYGEEPHPDVANSLMNLGNAYHSLSEYGHAIEYHQQALAVQKLVYGERHHPDVASSLMNLGNACHFLGDYSHAIDYHHQALTMKKEIYGKEQHPDIAKSLMGLGCLYYSLREYSNAIDCFQATLKIFKQIHDNQPNLKIAAIFNNLGKAYDSLNESSLAIDCYEESLRIKKKIHGERPHPDIAKSLTNLGTSYHSLRKYSLAIEYYQQALAILKQIHGEQPHSDVVRSLNNLGDAYCSLGSYSRAIEYHQEALAILKQIHGEQPHSDVAKSLNDLGYAYCYLLGDYTRAIDYYQQSFAISKQIYGEQPHPTIALTLGNLGEALNNSANPSEAIKYCELASAIYLQIYPNQQDPLVARNLRNLGNAYRNLGNGQKAIEYCEQSLAIFTSYYKESPHFEIAETLRDLGKAYQASGLLHQAIESLQKSYEMFKKTIELDDPEALKTSAYLNELLTLQKGQSLATSSSQ